MNLNLPILLEYLLNSLNLDWWQDISELTDGKGIMMTEKIREFLALIKNSQQVFPDYETITARHPVGIGTISYWHKQYADAKRELVRYLEANIKAQKPIRFEM